jgi:hypothetical protein
MKCRTHHMLAKDIAALTEIAKEKLKMLTG